MRLAAIGLPAPPTDLGDRITPIRFRDDIALDGFEAVLWNPNELTAEYGADLAEDGALTVRGSEACLADIRRRRQEMLAFLEDGGSLVIEPPHPTALRVHTLETIIALPLAQALPVDGLVTVADRPQALSFHGGEPFRSFWQMVGRNLEPAVRLDAAPGEVLLRDSASGGVFGSYWAHRRGRVLLLPWPQEPGTHLAALMTLIEALVGADGGRPPRWINRYITRDEQPLHDALQQLERERAELSRRIAAAQRALYPFERRKQLFAAAGKPLLDVVQEVFWSLGCSVLQGPYGETDLVIEHGSATALAHIVGGAGPVGRDELERLDGWIAALGTGYGEAPKGLLIVNPYKDMPPERRPALDPLLIDLAARRGHAVISTVDLLGLAVAASAVPDRGADALAQLFGTAGLVTADPLDSWLTIDSRSA